MCLMRVKLSEGISFPGDPPFFWHQETGRPRRLVIPEPFSLHGLRIFPFHHSRAELAAVASVPAEPELWLWKCFLSESSAASQIFVWNLLTKS
jgi:hypothetical protein